MIPCPKCDAQVHDGTRRCPLCGTPIAVGGFRPERRADPVIDPMLDLFERDEMVRSCEDCLNEFVESRKACRGCGRPLQRCVRSEYERILVERPLRELGDSVAAGPPLLPRDLVRVKIAVGLDEAHAILEELQFIGLEPVAGSDTLDPFTEPEHIGIYVRGGDREAASYLIDGVRPADPLARPPSNEEVDVRGRVLERARGYGAIGKYRDALRELELLEDDGDALALAAELLLRSGNVRAAERHAQEAAGSIPLERERGWLLAQAGLMKALGHDGTPFGQGCDLPAAATLLSSAVELSPRLLRVGKVRAEIAHARGDRETLAATLHALERVNANLFGRDGWWRELKLGMK